MPRQASRSLSINLTSLKSKNKGIFMAIYDDVLAALPKFEADAVSAKDLFDTCPGAESVVEISTALSKLFIAGRIKRKDYVVGKSRYAYWCDDVDAVPVGVNLAPKAAPVNVHIVRKEEPAVNVSSIGAMVAALEDNVTSIASAPKEFVFIEPTAVDSSFTVSVEMKIDLPAMPDTFKLSRVKKSGNHSVSDGVLLLDVTELDDAAVDKIAAQWAAGFRAHVHARRQQAA